MIGKKRQGNVHDMFVVMGASNHSAEQREGNDFYATSPEAVEKLLEKETFNKNVWECACVDNETEYFNGSEWKKISKYVSNDKVLCFDGQNGVLLTPEKYHKYQYDGDFYHYKSKNLDMMITPEHRVVYYPRRKNILEIKSAKEVFDMYDKDTNGFRGKIPTTFFLKENYNLHNINEWEVRLAVVCNADGRSRTKNTYQVRIKKESKKERLELLLNKCNINYKYKFYQGYHNYTFPSPLGGKTLPKEWIFLPNNLKEAFLDEIYRWNGLYIYYSSKKSDIDIVQMIAHSIGVQAKVDIDKRKDKKTYISYRIIFKNKTNHALIKNKYNHLMLEKSNDGYKYCFTVETGMLILRRNNKIFITGNCGQGHISKVLKSHGYNVYSSDLIDRGYGQVQNFFKIEKVNGDIITNPPYKLATEFVYHALEVVNTGSKVAFLLKIQFLESEQRRKLFNLYPQKYVYVFSKRVSCAKNAEFEKSPSSAICYAWFIWIKGSKTEPIIRWL